jgi:hypothetical protein
MSDTYLKALNDARKELEGLIQERAQLDDRIARLGKSIEGLASLCDDADHSDDLKTKLVELELSETMGLSSAIRQIINASVFPVTAPALRDALVDEGFDPKKYSNMLTVIHNTLLRLEKQGEIHRASNMLGMRGWQATRSPAHDSGMRGNEKSKPPLTSSFGSPTPRVTKKE